jgi:hypothetical protein|tara:strand:- start:111 stop:326 length:216 start_codon:yes stop_codon:yes gene_type:complete
VGLKDENVIRVGGWLLSLLCILIGSYFVWPHIHVALLGIAFFYFGVRIFNFSTFKEYAKKRQQLLTKLQGW